MHLLARLYAVRYPFIDIRLDVLVAVSVVVLLLSTSSAQI